MHVQCNGVKESAGKPGKSVTCALDLDILGRQIQQLLKVKIKIYVYTKISNDKCIYKSKIRLIRTVLAKFPKCNSGNSLPIGA